jgi:uncharacterized protein
MKKYRIVTLDGGGIRGLVPIVLMQRLEAAVPGWLGQADFIAGTSTGGIIALALAKGLTLNQIFDLYYHKGSYIFYRPFWHRVLGLGGLIRARNPNNHLREVLEKELGEITLGELDKKVLISAFNLNDEKRERWKPKFFHNFEGSDSDSDLRAAEVAMYTSAAPAYLPTVDTYLDGGVAANNPSMAALLQTQDERAQIPDRPALADIRLLSFGTGDALTKIQGKNHDWGYLQWGWDVRILQILMDGTVGIPHYQCEQLLGEKRYRRINPILPSGNFDLDDTSKSPALVEFAKNVQDLYEEKGRTKPHVYTFDNMVQWLRDEWA